KAYARQSPASPVSEAAQRAEAPPSDPPRRVRVVQGVLVGLTGQVVSTSDSERWLVKADQGLLVRIRPQLLELLPPA
ncbi:MAG: hypothetical protein WEH44_10630, partial [Pirellulaceae bacterium]